MWCFEVSTAPSQADEQSAHTVATGMSYQCFAGLVLSVLSVRSLSACGGSIHPTAQLAAIVLVAEAGVWRVCYQNQTHSSNDRRASKGRSDNITTHSKREKMMT